MKAKFTARAEYSNGHASNLNGYGCISFASEAEADAWATEQIQKDPGATVTVWKANTAEIHGVYCKDKHLNAEEQAHYEENAASNMRYIRAKLPTATPRQLSLVAAFVRGMGIVGWTEQEDA